MKIFEFNNLSELSSWAADFIIETSNKEIEIKGYFTLSMCGGSSPVQTLKNLADKKMAAKLNWDNIFIFWGDERFVDYSDRNSNFKLVNDLLLSQIPIPSKNIYKTPVDEPSAEKAAEIYEQKIKEFFIDKNGLNENGIPVFDIMLQGTGNDGHTASLFPGVPEINEKEKLVVNVKAPDYAPVSDRISFTFNLINSAKNIILLLSGNKKGQIAKNFIENNPESNLPIQKLNRSDKTTVLLDKSIYHS